MAQAIGPILSLVGTFMSMRGEDKAANEQERVAAQQRAAAEQSQRISRQNAAAIEAETAENVRREKTAAREEAATRRAKAAASGGTLGSFSPFLQEQERRATETINWMERAGKSRADIERERGRYSLMEGTAVAAGTSAEASARKSRARAGFLSSAAETGGKLWSMYGPTG